MPRLSPTRLVHGTRRGRRPHRHPVAQPPRDPFDDLEADLTVTQLAPCAQFAVMRIIPAVAGHAETRHSPGKQRPKMALRAFDPRVLSDQGIPRIFLVVKRRVFPIDLGVADLALLTEFPLVVVVLPVAVGTTRRRFVDEQRRDVTFGTCDLQMFSEQLKLRLLRVIEDDFFPTVCHVTGVALLSEIPLVIIVLDMTVGTSGGRVCKQRGHVALCATHGRVLAQEREAGLLMVELSDLLPCPLDVAPLAGVAQLAFVRIVLPVAGCASTGNLISLIRVTLRAAHGNVLADERIFRL